MKIILKIFILSILFYSSVFSADQYQNGRVAFVDKFLQYQSKSYTTKDGLAGNEILDIKVLKNNNLFIETSAGFNLFDGKKFTKIKNEKQILKENISKTLFTIEGPDIEDIEKSIAVGFPFNQVKTITVAKNGLIYYGTPFGLVIENPKSKTTIKDSPINPKFKYYGGKRWIPDNDINCIAVDKNGTVWVGTKNGLGKIFATKISLQEKAKYFLDNLVRKHIKDGFVRELIISENFLPHADNDGLWTALFIAAESFRYAVTKDPQAQKNAQNSYNSLEWQEKITGISGFVARSIVAAGEPTKRNYGGEWHLDTTGKWEWKGDTSSDELDGHFFAYSIFYDLAATPEYKERVKKQVTKIATHLIEHNYYYIDLDGKPTTHGIYNWTDSRWILLKGLNSLEILSHLLTTYHITKDKKFKDAYDFLVAKGYAKNTRLQKITLSINHSDDELSFLAYYPILKYETEPTILEIYKKSILRTWRFEEKERNPWWNFTYCAFMEGVCNIEDSVETLKEIPLDQRNWAMINSIRLDLGVDQKLAGRFGELESPFVLPYDEKNFDRWNGNPYRVDSGGDGNEEADGVLYLLPYWMGRYLGFVTEKAI